MRSFRYLPATLFLVAAAVFAPAPAHAAESYDNCTGFINSLPTTISTQGVWCLNKNLSTAITSGNAITIATNNVTIDCNDFKLGGLAAGLGTFADGVGTFAKLNATIRNCNIRGFRYGINLDGDSGGNHLIEDNRLDNNTFVGIAVDGDGSVIRRNQINDTGGTTITFYTRGWGIITNGTVDVIDNTVAGVMANQVSGTSTAHGIAAFVNFGGAIQRNRVRGLVPGPDAGANQIGIGSINSGSHPEISNNVIVGTAVDGLGDMAISCNSAAAAALVSGNRILRFAGGTAVSANCIDAGNITDSP